MSRIVRQTRQVRDQYTGDVIAFYNTGQLFLEEYYTLSIVAQAGLGTSNIYGNTRLCTATAEQALSETFGTDGQPGPHTDFDVTDCLLLGEQTRRQQARLLTQIQHRAAHTLVVPS